MNTRYAYVVYAWFSPVDHDDYIDIVGVCTSRQAAISLMEIWIAAEAKWNNKTWIEENHDHNWRLGFPPMVNITSIEGPNMREAILRCDRRRMISTKLMTNRQRRKKK